MVEGVRAPTGTATVVLGDVAGSTRMWAEDADAMLVASRRLRELTDELAVEHRGHLPREQGEGDNLGAVFETSSDAMAFAFGLDRALAGEQWPGSLRIGMRLGLHVGEVEWDDATGYLGPTFNRCARIRDLGHPGQILVSRVFADLVADALIEGSRLEDLGTHQLRDLSRTEQVFQLRPPDDDRVHPALKSVSARPNNVPIPVTTLVGRDEEVREIAKLLTSERLVTLVGAGGSGKTRLAQHVGGAVVGYATDGAWWVDLMPEEDPDRVPTAIATAAGFDEVGGPRALRELVDSVRDARMLLLIDNCEHLIDAVADTVDALLRSCPNVGILATSREALDVDGEFVVPIAPLDLPSADQQVTAATLSEWAALRLFVERARSVGSFDPDDTSANTIATICRRLDGMPLAIELAAARTRLLSVDEIATGLDDRFALLDGRGRRRRRASRQRTLEASVAWSVDLLDDDEQEFLCNLAVMPGAFDLDGAAAVGAPGAGRADATELLGALVDRSLVAIRPSAGGRRYRLLETIRTYARTRLEEAGRLDAARDAHLDHVVTTLGSYTRDEVASGIHYGTGHPGDDDGAWAEDQRAAVAHARRRDRPADIVRVLWAYSANSMMNGGWRQILMELAPLVDDERIRDTERTQLHMMMAAMLSMVGQYRAAVEHGAEALRRAEADDDRIHICIANWTLSLARPYYDGGGVAEGRRSWEMAPSFGDGAVAITGMGYTQALTIAGEEATAIEVGRATIAACEAVGRPSGMMPALVICNRMTLPSDVAAASDELVDLVDRLEQEAPALIPLAVVSGTWCHTIAGRPERTMPMFERAIAAAGPRGSGSAAFAELVRIAAAIAAVDLPATIAAAVAAGDAFAPTDNRYWTAYADAVRACALVMSGDVEDARAAADRAAAHVPERGWMFVNGWVWFAEVLLAPDVDTRLDLARGLLRRQWSRRTSHEGGWTPWALAEIALCRQESGDEEGAAWVAGVIDGSHERTGAHQVPWWCDRYEAPLARVAERAPDAFAAGRTAPYDESVTSLIE